MDVLEALRGEDAELWSAPRLLRADIVEAAQTLTAQEARYLVDAYYNLQHYRIQAHNQASALAESAEPNRLTEWFGARYRQLEVQLQRVLDAYSLTTPVGQWSRAHIGIGPVLAGGLLAHLDQDPPATVGHWWSFAGLNPEQRWEKGAKRPWNAQLKTLCWKIGQSFVKCSNRPDCTYGALYKRRKAYEQERNAQGLYAEQAAHMLATKTIGADTEAAKHYREGHLPPGHIQARCERWTVKLYLAHHHEAAWVATHGTLPVKPYALGRLGHTTDIAPPHQDVIPGWAALRACGR